MTRRNERRRFRGDARLRRAGSAPGGRERWESAAMIFVGNAVFLQSARTRFPGFVSRLQSEKTRFPGTE